MTRSASRLAVATVAEHVPSIHGRVLKVVPHVFGGDKIGEPVPGADPDTAKTYLEWREKNRVVDPLERRRVDKGRQQPGADDSVVDHMAVPSHAAGGRRRGFRDCRVLGLCFGQPRLRPHPCAGSRRSHRRRPDALGVTRSASSAATVDLPAPGGPVTTISVAHAIADHSLPTDEVAAFRAHQAAATAMLP